MKSYRKIRKKILKELENDSVPAEKVDGAYMKLRKLFKTLLKAEDAQDALTINDEQRIIREAMPIIRRIHNDIEIGDVMTRKTDGFRSPASTADFLEFLEKISK